MARNLSRLASAFSAARALQVPLILATIAAVIFAFPPQTLELYASVAQDIAFAGGLADAFSDNDGRLALAVIVFGTASAIVLGLATWAASLSLGHASAQRSERLNTPVGRATIRVLAPLLAAVPIAAIGIGLLRSAYYTPTARFKVGLLNLFQSLGQDEKFANAWFRNIDSVGHSLWLVGWIHIAAAGAFIALLWLWHSRLHRDTPEIMGAGWAWGVLIAFGVSTLALLVLPISLWRWLGAICLLSLFFAGLMILASNVFRSSLKSGLPILSGLMLYAVLLSAFSLNDNHRLLNSPVATVAVPQPSREISSHFKTWLESRPDRAKFSDKGARYPVYIVAAQGGGIYAAYHTALALASLQDLCPAFASHLFAVSSVSGGSLGGATFRAVLTPDVIRDEPCADKVRWPLGDAVGKVLDADYLSPLVGYLLLPDLIQRFLPYAVEQFDRALALERVFIEQMALLPGDKSDVLRQPYLRHWQPAGVMPAMLFNTTEVASGRRRVVAPFVFSSREVSFLPLWGDAGALSPSLATAAIVSARFPWLTPSAWFDEMTPASKTEKSASRRIRLVDGGYFENSGVSTAHDLIRALDRELAVLKLEKDVEIFLLVFTSPEDAVDGAAQPFTDVLDPIRTLLNTRAARARAAVERAEEDLGVYKNNGVARPRVRRFPLESLGLQLPLGWKISSATKTMIEMQIGDFKRCPAPTDTQTNVAERFEADCVVRQIFDEINSGHAAAPLSR